MIKKIATIAVLIAATAGMSACAMLEGNPNDYPPPPWERNNHGSE